MKTLHKISIVGIVLVLFLSAVFGSISVVYAEETVDVTVSDFDSTAITDDLSDIDISEYPADNDGRPYLLRFEEYCYSEKPFFKETYGLYVYIYNPSQQEVVTSNRNVLNMAVSYNTDGTPDKYENVRLKYLSKTLNRRFYKFKVADSLTFLSLEQAYCKRHEKRRYDVASVQLFFRSGATALDNTVDQTYYWTGYSKGCGSDSEAESTLSGTVDQLTTLPVNVKHTVYRPQGDFYEGKQSQLNSCYFRIPERYFEHYGDLTKIAAEWYEYITKPMLVTENKTLYTKLDKLQGAPVTNFDSSMYFLLISLSNTDTSWFGKRTHGLGWASNYGEFADKYVTEKFWFIPLGYVDDAVAKDVRFNRFAAVFYTSDDVSYTDCYVSADDVEAQLLKNSEDALFTLPGTNFNRELFVDDVQENHTRGYNYKEIAATDDFDVYWNTTVKSTLWQRIFGGYDVVTEWDSMKAIQTVTDEDLKGNDQEISERLFVNVNEVPDLKAEYKKCAESKNGERLILFRFGTSDYYSVPTVEAMCSRTTENADEVLVADCYNDWKNGNYNGYLAQETVYLDFDVISFEFTDKDKVVTVIPVVSSPTNAIGGLNPPLQENYHTDNKGKDTLLTVLAIVAGVVLLIFVVWVISKIVPALSLASQARTMRRREHRLRRERRKRK